MEESSIPLTRTSAQDTYQSARTSSTQSPLQRENPSAPSPNSSSAEIQLFLKDFFLANDTSLDESQAEEIASKLRVNGESIYKLSREAFNKAFDAQGDAIYDIVQGGQWGYVSGCSFESLIPLLINQVQDGGYWVYIRTLESRSAATILGRKTYHNAKAIMSPDDPRMKMIQSALFTWILKIVDFLSRDGNDNRGHPYP